jgi:hypothetical protein
MVGAIALIEFFFIVLMSQVAFFFPLYFVRV